MDKMNLTKRNEHEVYVASNFRIEQVLSDANEINEYVFQMVSNANGK